MRFLCLLSGWDLYFRVLLSDSLLMLWLRVGIPVAFWIRVDYWFDG